MAHRIDLQTIPAADRQDLADLILQYLTDAVIDEHMTIVHSGVAFLDGHRAYIGDLETFLAANGGALFVPLPKWDPATPIPAEFNVVKARDNGTARDPLQNLTPNQSMPAQFAFSAVCSLQSGEELGNALNPWHGGVHGAVGGAMGDFMNAPAAPIFWCWHAFLDDIYFDWESCSNVEEPEVPTEEPTYEKRVDEYERRKEYWDELKDEPDHGVKYFEELEREYEVVCGHVPTHQHTTKS